MMPIGCFTRSESGYAGRIKTLTIDAEIVLAPTDPVDNANAPDYRTYLGDEDGPIVGAGWNRTSDRAGAFISLVIDDPVFTQPLRAFLLQSGNDGAVWTLHWSRFPRRDGQE